MPWDKPPRREASQDIAAPLASHIRESSGYQNDADTTENLIPVVLRGISGYGHGLPSLRGKSGDCGGGSEALVCFGGNNTSGPLDMATVCNAHGGPPRRIDFESETFITVTGNVTHALNTANNGKHCSEDGTGRGVPIIGFNAREDCVSSEHVFGALGCAHPQAQAVASNFGVRRLMPIECERLMGLPDGHTDMPAKDGPRYRTIGNGMVVPVMKWLFANLELHMKGFT